MATRLSIITTRGGDQGMTGLGDGSRIGKDAPRIAALGDVDELNSFLGLLRAEPLPTDVDTVLAQVQNDLFDLGAELCIPGHTAVTKKQVLYLEQTLARYNADLGPLKEFILPGGTRAAALAHVARTVCRRAERSVVAMERAGAHAASTWAKRDGVAGTSGAAIATDAAGTDDIASMDETQSRASAANTAHAANQFLRQYLNRLSDLCFVLARALNRHAGQADVQWSRDAG